MNANLESLREKHEELVVKAEEDPLSEDLLSQVDAFMQKVQRAGASVGDSLERNLLRSFLQYWGSYVYKHKGVYPNAELEPFTKLTPSPKVISPAFLLAAGALVLLAGTVSLFALGYLPVRLGTTAGAAVQLPTISKPEVSVSRPLKPGQEVGISVDISSVTGVALNYTWKTDGGEIVKGQGSPAIIYRVPYEPGTYNVRVVVEWDDQSVERAISIEVEVTDDGEGTGQVSSQREVSATSETYTVQSGDTLMGISRKLFNGDPQYWDEIADLNGIQAPYTIYPGDVLQVPEE